MTRIRRVILDVDGTLVDSNDVHTHAWVEALAQHGYDISFERIRSLIGKGGDKVLPETTGLEKDSDEGKAISKQRSEIFRTKYLPTLKAFPRVHELLQHMHDQGLKIVVASSAEKQELDALLEVAGATELVEQKTSSQDAKNSKPDPDIVDVALKHTGLQAGEMIMLGDTPYDLEAATKAGVATIALRCGGWDTPDLQGAKAIYDDPADLLAHYDDSPLGSIIR
ncbi:MAG: HAD family hydrolase [Herpetosiphonaceae bacterium]|nr:HAD family hydrolase [Herpetosiphonaceae bacterium]